MKWVFRLVGAIAVALIAFVVLLIALPAEKIARIATDQLSASTGRDVSISGDVSLTFWPVLGARANGLEVANATWAEQGPLLQAAQAAIGVDALSLLSGEIVITNIEADSPTIRLEQKLDGRANWEFTDASGGASIETETAPSRDPKPLSIQKLSVTNATLIYDAEGSDLVSYENVDLDVDWPERLGPATVKAELSPNAKPVTFEAVIDGFASFITGEVQTLTATLNSGSGSMSLDGRASTTGAVAGKISVQIGDTGAFSSELGLAPLVLPPKLGQQMAVTSDITLTPDRRLAVRNLEADLFGNRLTGAADISLNGVPQINAQLDAGELDLDLADTEAGSTGGSKASTRDGWSTSEIDASGLAAFNGDIALTASSVDFGDYRLGQTQTILRNDNARMVFELSDVSAYGGNVTGEFVMNNRNGLSVGGKMSAREIGLQPLLDDAIDFDRLTGQANIELSFLGIGSSVKSIMESLSGNGAMSLRRGTIEGFDLDEILRSGNIGSGTTVFEDLSASWKIENGVVSNEDMLLLLENYEASGEGDLDVGKRRIDYTITPVALRANSGQGIAIPVLFKGPWSDVSIRPDVEAVLEQQFDEERKALEDKAKEELSELLGLEAEEDQSTEDVLKEKLNKELRRLFD